MARCFIFDIDGTLANLEHRLPLIKGEKPDWDAFFNACGDDEPIEHIATVARAIDAFHQVVYVTGRSDISQRATIDWLAKHGMPIGALYMRKQGDHKPDHKLKLELLAQMRQDGFDPIMAFDDRKAVVDMWREAGLPCAQVAAGDF